MRTPYFRKDRNAWYCVVNGRRLKLSEDKAEAYAKWEELQVPSNDVAVLLAVQKFLDRPRKAPTQRFYQSHLNLFLGQVGGAAGLRSSAHHLTELFDQYTGNYAHNIARCVKTAFKWLCDSEHIARNPFAKVKTPPATARGDDAYIQPDRWDKIIGQARGDLLDILTVLKETGCRPKEARQLEARHLQDRICVLEKHESKGGRTRRVIHLSESAYAICAGWRSNIQVDRFCATAINHGRPKLWPISATGLASSRIKFDIQWRLTSSLTASI